VNNFQCAREIERAKSLLSKKYIFKKRGKSALKVKEKSE